MEGSGGGLEGAGNRHCRQNRFGRPTRPVVGQEPHGVVSRTLLFGNVCLGTRFTERKSSAAKSSPMFRREVLLRTLVALVALSAVGRVRAESELPLVPVASAEARLLADAADGVFDRHPFLRAALIAGGEQDEQQLHAHQERFETLCQPLDLRRAQGEKLTAEALFQFLHEAMLTGRYDAAVTTLPATLGRGDYNCLTATTLLVALGDRYACPIEAVATSGHIYCRSLADGRPLETTCREWFSRGGAIGDPSLKTKGAAEGRSVNRVQLVAKFYYNRGVALLADKQFERALGLLEISRQLDPRDSDARENLLAGLNNWALAETEMKRFETAARLLAQARTIDANYPPLAANDLHVHQRWAAWLCERHQYAAAIELLNAGSRRRPDAPLFTAGRRDVYIAWARWHHERGEDQLAAKVLAEARGQFGWDIQREVFEVPLAVEFTSAGTAAN